MMNNRIKKLAKGLSVVSQEDFYYCYHNCNYEDYDLYRLYNKKHKFYIYIIYKN